MDAQHPLPLLEVLPSAMTTVRALRPKGPTTNQVDTMVHLLPVSTKHKTDWPFTMVVMTGFSQIESQPAATSIPRVIMTEALSPITTKGGVYMARHTGCEAHHVYTGTRNEAHMSPSQESQLRFTKMSLWCATLPRLTASVEISAVLPDAGKFPCFREILGPKVRKFPCLGKFWALFLRVSIRVYISIYVRLILPVSTIYITGTFFVK